MPAAPRHANPANPVDAALLTRRSVRAFLPTPVPRADIEAILEAASRAPSGTNMQPWRVYVVTGESLARLSGALLAAHDHPQRDELYREEYRYYPQRWASPYLDRRRKIGWDMYGLLGIEKGDKARMHEQHAQNYRFFGAPVGLFFTIDRALELGSWLDYGMFLQAIMTAARGRGLDTCPQAAFTQFHQVIATHLALPDNEQLVCGMSLGFADERAPVNGLHTEREAVGQFTRFLD
jgi:nitroreductase